jgi:DNA-binding response OmpR family regulator
LKKVLVVDDETDIAEVVKRGLELQGMQVDAFNDPQKALEHFKPNTYEVVVLDIRMPRMNGFQLYREIMKRDDKARVLFITAFEESPEEFRKAFPELDAHRFMRKPFTISKLKDRILQGIGNQGPASRDYPKTS